MKPRASGGAEGNAPRRDRPPSRPGARTPSRGARGAPGARARARRPRRAPSCVDSRRQKTQHLSEPGESSEPQNPRATVERESTWVTDGRFWARPLKFRSSRRQFHGSAKNSFVFARRPLLALLDEAVLRARRRVFRPQQARAGRRRGRGRRWRGRGRARCPNAPAEELHDVELQLVSRPDAQRARQEIVPALRRGPRPGYHRAAGDVAARRGARSVRYARPRREKSRYRTRVPPVSGVSIREGAGSRDPRRRGHPTPIFLFRNSPRVSP